MSSQRSPKHRSFIIPLHHDRQHLFLARSTFRYPIIPRGTRYQLGRTQSTNRLLLPAALKLSSCLSSNKISQKVRQLSSVGPKRMRGERLSTHFFSNLTTNACLFNNVLFFVRMRNTKHFSFLSTCTTIYMKPTTCCINKKTRPHSPFAVLQQQHPRERAPRRKPAKTPSLPQNKKPNSQPTRHWKTSVLSKRSSDVRGRRDERPSK